LLNIGFFKGIVELSGVLEPYIYLKLDVRL